jgi:hypothetical protein
MALATVSAVLGLTAWTPAHADPGHARNAVGLQIGCDNGRAYAGVMNGHGRFSAIHDLSSRRVLVPVAVGKALVTVLDADLKVLSQWTTPRNVKQQLLEHHKKSLVTCDVIGFDPRADGTTVTVLGTMIAKVAPVH